MSQGPPVGPLVVVATPEHDRLPEPVVPPVEQPAVIPPSELLELALQPQPQIPKIATSEIPLQKSLVLIGIHSMRANSDTALGGDCPEHRNLVMAISCSAHPRPCSAVRAGANMRPCAPEGGGGFWPRYRLG